MTISDLINCMEKTSDLPIKTIKLQKPDIEIFDIKKGCPLLIWPTCTRYM